MRRFRILAIGIVLFGCLAAPASATLPKMSRIYDFKLRNPYKDKSVFVSVPAKLGSIVGNTVGFAAGIPLGMLGPRVSGNAIRKRVNRFGAYVAGFPFFVAKKVVGGMYGSAAVLVGARRPGKTTRH